MGKLISGNHLTFSDTVTITPMVMIMHNQIEHFLGDLVFAVIQVRS